MKLFAPLASIALAASLVAAPALAGPMDMAVKAREGLMLNFAFNLGVLGGMAKGVTPYDAKTAQTAADNLVALSSIADQGAYWPKGSDNSAMKTLALPEIWQKPEVFAQHWDQLKLGAANMKLEAGKDLTSLQGAMNSVGGACGSCHKAFREPM